MIGTRLGHYMVLEQLGAGGMGVVYRARDEKLGRDVALKLLPDELAGDRERIERLTREARAVAGLNHPNIVTIHSIEECDGRHFITMELVTGKTLDQLIGPGGMSAERFLTLAAPLAEALTAAHRVGVVHRDLKPSNVMLTDDGRPKILDFGLAKRLDDSRGAAKSTVETAPLLTQEGAVVGTLPYMAPEQLQGRPTDVRSDVYSFGAMLFEMATGQRPLKRDSEAELVTAILRDPPPPVTRLRAELPADLERIVSRCLEKDPDRRYQTSRDVFNELTSLANALPSSASGRSWQSASDSSGRRASAAGHDPNAIRSLAVLPLEHGSRDPAQAYFADGMTEALFPISRASRRCA